MPTIYYIAYFTLFHAAFSFVTGHPKVIAAIPGILMSVVSIGALAEEHKYLGLERPLKIEICIILATSIAMIAIPLFASIIASRITDSTLPNSLITATLGIVGLLPIKFMNILEAP